MHTDQEFMREAYLQALKSFQKNGIPIGAILVRDNVIIGRGHNQRVQHGDPIAHGEMDCIRNAGRQANYKNTTLYTTLSPCKMCSGVIVQYKIPRVVIGEATNFKGNIEYLKDNGVDVLILNDEDCIDLMKRYNSNNPDIVLEDIGGQIDPEADIPKHKENNYYKSCTKETLSPRTRKSAEVLLQLYTVAMGVAFSLAAKNCFTPQTNNTNLSVSFMLFLAYSATYIPFFHGCAALFKDTYIDNPCCRSKLKVLVLDFSLMFIHAFFFSVLAAFITNPIEFSIITISLFAVDIAWCIAVINKSPSPRQISAATTWKSINSYVIATSLLLLPFAYNYNKDNRAHGLLLASIALATCIIRTIFDYKLAWNDYFGKDKI